VGVCSAATDESTNGLEGEAPTTSQDPVASLGDLGKSLGVSALTYLELSRTEDGSLYMSHSLVKGNTRGPPLITKLTHSTADLIGHDLPQGGTAMFVPKTSLTEAVISSIGLQGFTFESKENGGKTTIFLKEIDWVGTLRGYDASDPILEGKTIRLNLEILL
jgi:hypothetical protein